MANQYFGEFNSREDVAREFEQCANKWGPGPIQIVEGFPTDAEILFAEYEISGYEGGAFVLFERDGKLYEVHGSHCSCHGLEGQWTPDDTTWAALAMRPQKEPLYDSDADAIAAYRNLINAHVPEAK
jgi:hypothetical protein